jgi:hypothetical protein
MPTLVSKLAYVPMGGKGPGTHRKGLFFPGRTPYFRDGGGEGWTHPVGCVGIVRSRTKPAHPGPNRVQRKGGETQLRVKVRLLAEECEAAPPCHALIETGAEVCIVRKNVIPQQFFQPAERPLRLVGANARKLEGGDKEVLLMVCISGVHTKTNQRVELRILTTFYGAAIKDDIILSYDWCIKGGVEIHPPIMAYCVSKEGPKFGWRG